MKIMPYSSTADGLDVEYRVVDPSDYSEVTPLTAAVPGETNEYLTATAIPGGLRVLWYEDGVFQIPDDVPEQSASIAQATRQELATELNRLDAKVSDAISAAALPAPEGWVAITPASLDTDGVALGALDAAGMRLVAYVSGTAVASTDSEGDGGYTLYVPPSATYTLRVFRAGYSYPERMVTVP